MRVVGGSLRGRPLAAPQDRHIRPTSDRTRESLFDLLTQGRAVGGEDRVRGARVLDAFAGTGALGIEALSRGAGSAVFMEKDRAALGLIDRNLQTLGLKASARVLPADCLMPPPSRYAVDLLLMDPPYGEDLAGPAVSALKAAGWLASGSLIALEIGAKDSLSLPDGIEGLDERRYGRARILLLACS